MSHCDHHRIRHRFAVSTYAQICTQQQKLRFFVLGRVLRKIASLTICRVSCDFSQFFVMLMLTFSRFHLHLSVKPKSKARVHNRGSQIPPSRLFSFYIPLSRHPALSMYESRSRPDFVTTFLLELLK